jgi:hypothetical protein
MKKIKDAAQHHAEKHAFRVPYNGTKKFYDDTDLKASIDGFNAGVEFAQRWIPIEEELPTDTYLGKDEHGKVELFRVFESSFIRAVGITHWRYISLK